MSLFCGNISHNASPRDVESLFVKFGQCRVDVKRGFAFIDFDDDLDAEDAMKDLQGQHLNGMPINVEWSKRHLARSGSHAGRRQDYGRDRGNDRGHDRGNDRGHDRGYDRGHDRGHDRGGRGGYDRERRHYDDRGRGERYQRREDRPERSRDERNRDRDDGKYGPDRTRDRTGDRAPVRNENRDSHHGRRGERNGERPEGKERSDGSPRGAGVKRPLDDGPVASEAVEHGDSARRRTEAGYEREKDREFPNGNGNSVANASEDREYRNEHRDERKENRKDEPKDSFDDRRDDRYADNQREGMHRDDDHRKEKIHDVSEGDRTPPKEANGTEQANLEVTV